MTKADSGSCGHAVAKRAAASRAKRSKPAAARARAAKSEPEVSLGHLLECPLEEFVKLMKKPVNRVPGLLHALADGDASQLHSECDQKLAKLLSKTIRVVLTEVNVDGETACIVWLDAAMGPTTARSGMMNALKRWCALCANDPVV